MYVHCDDAVAEDRVKERGDDLEVYQSRHRSENDMFEAYRETEKYDVLFDNSCPRGLAETKLHRLFDTMF